MSRKKRVLFVTESNKLASGFGTYAKQVLERLHATGKYELAEFASYGIPDHGKDVGWTFFANSPVSDDDRPAYDAQPANHFGYWRFDKVVLSFKPDIVLTYRDPWMDNWIADSPLRDFFHWVWMPTVDSAPQKREWLETFADCDALFTYSEFGTRTLEAQSRGTLNVIGCASPALDPDIYTPVVSKGKHKEEFGIPSDSYVVGTVMRNQKRKLFIELMKSFRIFLDNAPAEIADKSYLYLHTSYPEKQGWNIAEGIIDNELASKVLVTYVCRHCHDYFASSFQDALTRCPKCRNVSCVLPSVAAGLEIPDLVKVYNLMDMYVQYAICEGFGMPQVEAASCGVPVAATDYSAMEDVVRFTNGYPIKVKNMYRELETDAERAYPDNEHLAEILLEHSSLSPEERGKVSMLCRNGAMARYNWNDTANIWADYIDTYTPVGLQGKWDAPPRLFRIPTEKPNIPSNEAFVRWAMVNVADTPEKAYSYQTENFIKSLNLGAVVDGGSLEPFDRDKFWAILQNKAKNKLICEQIRCGMSMLPDEPFLNTAYQGKEGQ